MLCGRRRDAVELGFAAVSAQREALPEKQSGVERGRRVGRRYDDLLQVPQLFVRSLRRGSHGRLGPGRLQPQHQVSFCFYFFIFIFLENSNVLNIQDQHYL